MPDPEPDFEVILKDLARAGVDFITPPVDDVKPQMSFCCW
jgi:hypothetical protein